VITNICGHLNPGQRNSVVDLKVWEVKVNIRDKVAHPYRITGKIIPSYILMFMFLDSRRKDKRFWTEWSQALPELNPLLISS
jgi:hypothetical protein